MGDPLALSQILTHESDLVARFVALLEEEQDALKRALPEALPDISQKKLAIFDALDQSAASRQQLLGTAQNADQDDRQRMASWLAAHPEEKTIAATWATLIKQAHEARRLNSLNASLVKLHLDKTATALSILTRHAQETQLYGSNGHTLGLSGRRILDSA